MEHQIAVTVSAALATKQDVFMPDETPKENKIFCLYYRPDDELYGMYKISGIDMFDVAEAAKLLAFGSLYKLIEPSPMAKFSFQLNLKVADEFDFFWTPKFVKENTVYFARVGGQIKGPYILKESADKEKLLQALSQKLLFIPSSNQDFRPIHLKNSA